MADSRRDGCCSCVWRLKVFHPGVRDLGSPQLQGLEPRQPFEMNQPGVGDLGLDEVQRLKLGQPRKANQPGVGEMSVPEVHQDHRLARALIIDANLAAEFLDFGNGLCLLGVRFCRPA